MTKLAKSDVNYSPGKKAERCFLCEHYVVPRRCEVVAGDIRPDYWCEKFNKRRT